MKLSRYVVGTLLCFILTSCSTQTATNNAFVASIYNVNLDNSLQTLKEIVDQSDYIVIGEIMASLMTDRNIEEVAIKVLDQYKGLEDKVGQVINIQSAEVLSHEGTTYLLFVSENILNDSEEIRYESLSHPNPIFNNRFIEGPFNNMSFKEIRRDVICCVERV
ncbi:hypothetical protein [Paenibacillus endoradicis]|uniref:hypothetical protein n=1 Tax=Paenibacillus endoradicis TaxID=2972487 RepID=UPI0021593539|nr:hypothetical protein [Paenibacillus endoradicis]MCR8657633.1 hypothetical protein [Paenibacillus endoradicis]